MPMTTMPNYQELQMRPMTHEEAQQIILEWADVLAGDDISIVVGFDSDGPIILIMATRQGNVLQWFL